MSAKNAKSAAKTATKNATNATKSVADFLQAHDKMSAILPAAARLVTLQQDCAAALPAVFDVCSVLYFASGQLTVATPTAGFAAKLKQQLPKLQSHLLKRGWQVNAIRLKVQVLPTIEKPLPPKQLTLPKQAVSAFAELADALSNSPRDTMLKEAVVAMVRRYS